MESIETFQQISSIIKCSSKDLLFVSQHILARLIVHLVRKFQKLGQIHENYLNGAKQLLSSASQIYSKSNIKYFSHMDQSLQLLKNYCLKTVSNLNKNQNTKEKVNFILCQKYQQKKVARLKDFSANKYIHADQPKMQYVRHQLRNRNNQQLTVNFQINQKLSQITYENCRLSTPQCLGCCQTFYYEEKLKNFNHFYANYIPLTSKQICDKDTISVYICAIANQGRGILIGGTRKQNRSAIIGSYFSDTQKNKIAQILNEVRCSIYPLINIQIDFVPVQNNIFLTYTDRTEQINRFCLKILVKPDQIKKLHYIKIDKNSGYDPIYEPYVFKTGKPKLLQSHQMYEYLMNLYSNKIQKINPHSFGQCYLSRNQTCFYPYTAQNFQHNQMSGKYQQEKLQSLEPSYKFSNSSLLIVGSQKKSLFIKKFTQSLTDQKKLYDLQIPFQQIAKKCGRKIYFLSHYDKPQVIKQTLNKYDKSKNIKFIPLHKCMRIPVDKVSVIEINQMCKKYKQFYHDLPFQQCKMEAPVGNGLVQTCYFFQFDNLSCTILAYIVFESLGIRPFLLKYVPKINYKNY